MDITRERHPIERLPRRGGYPLGGPDPRLKKYEVRWKGLKLADLQGLKRVLASARDERPLQVFLGEHPHAMVLGALAMRKQCWVIPKPRFGSKWVPDFLIGQWDSLGAGWMLVELESPRLDPLTSRDSLSRHVQHAVQQIQDYRRWLGDKALYLVNEEGFSGIQAGCAATIIMGRRRARTALGQGRLADLRRDNIEVMSYDRLVDQYHTQNEYIRGQRADLRELRRQIRQRNAV